MPSSRCLDWPFDVQSMYQMWKEWLTVLGQHMVSNELTGAHHSQFWHFNLSPSASGGCIHPLVCPQLCVFENWPSPSHLQKTEFFPCTPNFSEWCLCPHHVLPMLTAILLQGLACKASGCHPCIHTPHTFTRRRQRQRNEALPEQPQKLVLLSSLGTPCHTQQRDPRAAARGTCCK